MGGGFCRFCYFGAAVRLWNLLLFSLPAKPFDGAPRMRFSYPPVVPQLPQACPTPKIEARSFFCYSSSCCNRHKHAQRGMILVGGNTSQEPHRARSTRNAGSHLSACFICPPPMQGLTTGRPRWRRKHCRMCWGSVSIQPCVLPPRKMLQNGVPPLLEATD